MGKHVINVRDRQIEYEELDAAMAVPMALPGLREGVARSGYMAEITEAVIGEAGVPGAPVSPDQLAPFARAGWTFVVPTSKTLSALRSGESSDALRATGGQRVLRRSDGAIAITTNRLVLQLAPGDRRGALKTIQKERIALRPLGFGEDLYVARVPEGREPFDVLRRLSDDPGVASVEPELVEHLPQRFVPNDPDYPRQWQHNGSGIGSEPAWDVATGRGVRVAIIDNGFDVKHPDLKGGIDADTAGYFSEDPVGDAAFELGTVGFPNGAHGTFCAGMAVARSNQQGGCGVAFDAEFIPIACLTDQVGTQVTLARALAYAADPTTEGIQQPGADVISCSLGPNGARWVMTRALELAIDFATSRGRGGRGTPILWACTNGDFQISDDDVCSHPKVMAVSRMNGGERHDQAGHGAGLEFLAPGVDVYSTTRGRTYGFGTGCSYAAPCAAGVAALVLQRNPKLSWSDCRDVLRRTCRQVGGVAYDANGWHERYGHGCVDALGAVRSA